MSARWRSSRGSWLAVVVGAVIVATPVRGAFADDAPGSSAAGSSSPKKDALELVASSEMVRVEVDSSLLDAEYIALWVRDDVQKVLDERGVDPKQTERRLVVRVTGTDQDRQLEVRVVEGGEAVGDAVPASSCGCITQSELMAAVRTRVEARLPDLVAKPETSGPPKGNDGAAQPPPNGSSAGPRRPLRAMGKAGVALIAGGTAVLVTGAVFLGLGRSVDDGIRTTGRDYGPPGIALTASGAALVAVGIGLLVADRVRARRTKTAFSPSFAPGFAGMSFHGRF